jgi:hypothetical protein
LADAHVFDGGEVAGWPQRTGLRCLARVERLVEEGHGSGVGDPDSLTAVAGNLPALRLGAPPLPWMRISRAVAPSAATSTRARKPTGTLTATVLLRRGPL